MAAERGFNLNFDLDRFQLTEETRGKPTYFTTDLQELQIWLIINHRELLFSSIFLFFTIATNTDWYPDTTAKQEEINFHAESKYINWYNVIFFIHICSVLIQSHK